jgi:hypothetical protein
MTGDVSRLAGDCSGLWGSISGLRGNCSGLWGECSGLTGDLDQCEITDEDRARGVDVRTLVETGPAVPGKEA